MKHKKALTGVVALVCIAAVPARAADLMLQSGFVGNGGEQIYFESVGSGSAVVLSHGRGGNHAVWYQQVPELAERYRVVTWDQRGFGRSSNVNEQAGPISAVDDLRALLDHLGIPRAHLVGQSMGGWAVMGFALKYPERVESLVLADTIAGVLTPEAVQAGESALRRPAPDQLPIQRHSGISDALGIRDPAKAFLYRQLGSFASPGAGGRLMETSYPLDEVRRMRLPVLLIVGADDTTFPPAAIRSVAAEIAGARVVVLPGAGHSPYFETPDAWNQVVIDFLATTDQP